jgi:hypothetical protein
MNKRAFSISMAAIGLATVSASTLACSACGCSLDADWPTPAVPQPRPLLDFRYDYLNLTELRAGSHAVDRASLSLPNDDEIQRRTRSRILTTMLDYPLANSWGVHLALPYVDRFHTTVAPGDSDVSTSSTHGIGDLRAVFRRELAGQDSGLQFGLKLPTGKFHDRFNAGPQAGEQVDRGLQAGTGTTDLILGAYHAGQVNQQFGYFGHLLLQAPLNTRDEFKPSTKLNLNLGVRYQADARWTPQLQLNIAHEGRESGALADRDNSGSLLVHLSPGFSAKVGNGTELYGFLQLPVYQHVNGLQLEPKSSASLGLRFTL